MMIARDTIDLLKALALKYQMMVLNGKRPWKPRENERYYYPLSSDKDLWGGTTWTDSNYDNIRLNRGLVFKTIEEAVAAAEKMLAVVKEER